MTRKIPTSKNQVKQQHFSIGVRLAGSMGSARVHGAVFVVLAAGIIAGGWAYYRNYEQGFHIVVEHKLMAVAELKVRELTQYRRERLGDGEILDTPAFAQLAGRFLEQPAQAASAQSLLESWLHKYTQLADYDEVRLLDAQGVTRLGVPAGLGPADPILLEAAARVLKSGRIAIQDFYLDGQSRRASLALLVPVRDATDATDARRRLGVVVLRIDPQRYLYPFIQRWPAANQTAETLLVRREGKGVLFLNDLRFRDGTAVTLLLPQENKRLPAMMAVKGVEGIMEGRDYREVPVIAALRGVPDSSWFLVAKMDVAEAYGPQHEYRAQLIAMVGALLLGTAAYIGLIWNQQRVRHYRELDLAQTTLQVAMDQSPAGIAIADAPSGTLRYVNDAGLLIRGGDREAIINGIGINQYVASWHLMDLDGRELAAEEVPLTRAVLFGEACSREFIIRRDGGEDRHVLAKAAPILDEHGTVAAGVVVFMDITEHRQLELKLQVTLADMERSNRELEQFAYVASHDLQEPLRMVTSYVQLLAQRYEGQLDARGQKYIHYAVDGAQRMQALINDLLDYSRVGRPGQTQKATDLEVVLGEALLNLGGVIAENQARMDHDALPTVPGNAAQLVLLFQNLLSNAIKFRGAQPPCVRISAQDCGGEWLIAVKDNGVGIEAQHAQRVFVIFQRLHTREEYPGTGIGLAVCQRVVEQHGGKIWFESVPGHGSTFFFTLAKQTPFPPPNRP